MLPRSAFLCLALSACTGTGTVTNGDLLGEGEPDAGDADDDPAADAGAGLAACDFGGESVPSGASVTAYEAATVPFGETCVTEERSCDDGALSGSYEFATCMVAAAGDCLFDGAAVTDGAGVTAYQSASVGFGGSCVAETRTCSNGVLSGSFAAPACTVDSLHFADLTPGTWTIPCQAGNGYSSYQSRFISGAENYVEVQWTIWDTTCANVLYRDYQLMRITEVVETPDSTGTTFTWRYDKLEDGLQPMAQSYTDYFNTNSMCGHAGYTTGVYFGNAPPSCGAAVQYWRARLERIGDVQSLFSADTSTGGGATPETRPTAVDRRPAYTRTLTLSNTVPNPMSPGSLRP